MNLDEICNIVNGVMINKSNKKIKDIKINSKEVNKDDLFICISGKKYDGHDFIDEVIKKKVGAIIVDRNINKKIPMIKVNNTLEALKKLAIYKRNNFNGIVIAITGSVGKTSTKELLATILKEKYNVVCNKNSNNNIIGLSLTLLDLKEETEVLLTELGMNHEGEIKQLSLICKPYIGVITNVGTSHIGNLKCKKNIYKVKLEITEGLNKGKLFINGDDKYLRRIKPKNNYSLIKCGIKKDNNFTCLNIKKNNERLYFAIVLDNKIHHFSFNIPSLYYINNLLIVIRISLMLGIDIEIIKDKINNYNSFNRRLKIYNYPSVKLIDDSYNSSLESLKSSLSILSKEEKKILVIGDIKETGKYSKKIHKKIGKLINPPNCETLIIGSEISILKNKYKYFKCNNDIIDYLRNRNLEDCTIFIKGSNSLKLDEVSKYLKERFDRYYKL